ncbi:MAG: hypothetical protein KGL58_01105 [Pseudomonadota bacterium]|nr:hypothetical protein [Pseudomonadota bacterium]
MPKKAEWGGIMVLSLMLGQSVWANGLALSHKTLVMSQVVVQGQSTFFARIASADVLASGYRLDTGGRILAQPQLLGGIAVQSYPDGMNEATLLAEARFSLDHEAGPLARQLGAYMHSHGIAFGWFSYDETVNVAGNPHPLHLVWSMALDENSRTLYGDPRLIPEQPSILYALYTPRAVMSGLPQEFAYARAGYLDWIVVNDSFEPMTGWMHKDTGGAFDAPRILGGVTAQPGWSLACLMDESSHPGCPRNAPDIRTLVNQYGAMMGLVDVVEQVQPAWSELPNGQGGVDEVAKLGVSVDSRSWKKARDLFFIYPAGRATFSETGRIGYELQENVDRYVYRSGSDAHILINRFSTSALSPVQPFSKSVFLSAGQENDCEAYLDNIIDPFATSQVFNWRHDTVNGLPANRYTYVAALECHG